jgi:tetratricopeptide (TPR) repeat protein
MLSKEKILLAVVAAVVAGVAATDASYSRVGVPSTKAPTDYPTLPEAQPAPPRVPPPKGRSAFDPFNDLAYPEPVVLRPLPLPAVPIAPVPTRPWTHLDASTGVARHLFFDAKERDEKASEVETEPASGGEESSTDVETAPIAEEERPKEEPPPDLADFDWVVYVGGAPGQRNYGKIELLDADREKGRTRFELVVDPGLEFTFWPVDPKTGKHIGGAAPTRARCQELGLADTFENNYGIRRAQLEARAGSRTLDVAAEKELVKWCLEQASLPRYPKRQAWARAAEGLASVQRRATGDKENLKELGRVYRLLQDFEAEAGLYEWWLSSQKIAKDAEVSALLAATLDLLGLKDRARALYEDSLEGVPDPRVRVRLGDLLLSTGGLDDARDALECFRRATADGERVLGPLGEARAVLRLGDVAEAARILDRIASPDRGADWFNARGSVHYAMGSLEDARGHFQAALERCRPGDDLLAVSRTNLAAAKARIAVGMAEEDAQGQANPARRAALEDAVKTADEALVDDPSNYYWPLVVKGYALRALGDSDRAVEALQEAVGAHPIEAYGRTLLGEFLLRDGRAAEARTQFQEAARLSPRFSDALAGVGRCGGGEPGETGFLLKRAIDLDPRSPLWPILAGQFALQDERVPLPQRLEEVRKILQAFLSRPDQRASAIAQAALGRVLYGQGDPDGALSMWNSANRNLAVANPTSAKEAALVKALADWVKEAIEKVSKWKRTRIWTDEFKRANGSTVGNGWNEDEKNVRISLRENAVAFGPGALGNGETPRIWRDEDQAKVLQASITVVVAPSEGFELDAMFYLPGQGGKPVTLFGVRKTEGGELRLLVKPDAKVTETQMVKDIGGMKWPDDGRITIGFEKIDEATGRIRLELNGAPIEGYDGIEVQSLIKSRGGKLRFEVRVVGGSGIEVNAKVEKVQVWKEVQ